MENIDSCDTDSREQWFPARKAPHRLAIRLLTRERVDRWRFLNPLRVFFLRRMDSTYDFKTLTREDRRECIEMTHYGRVRSADGAYPVERERTPLAVLSPRYFREHPNLAKANLCRLLGLRALEQRFLDREAEDLALRCGPVEERGVFWAKGLLSAEVDRKLEEHQARSAKLT